MFQFLFFFDQCLPFFIFFLSIVFLGYRDRDIIDKVPCVQECRDVIQDKGGLTEDLPNFKFFTSVSVESGVDAGSELLVDDDVEVCYESGFWDFVLDYVFWVRYQMF